MVKRRIFVLLSIFALIMFFAFPSFAENWKWDGKGISGNVEMRVMNKTRMVAAEQIAAGLGYKTETQKEELLIRANTGLRFVNGASVAWLGYNVVPLKARTRMGKDGHWWIAADSALDIFSSFLSKNGRNLKLRWAGKAPDRSEPSTSVASSKDSVSPKNESGLPKAVGLRWGIPAPDVIRAVIDLEGLKEPKYDVTGNSVIVEVSSIDKSVSTSGFPNYPDISVKIRKESPSVVEFAYKDRSANVFILKEPYRLVIDFKAGQNLQPPQPKKSASSDVGSRATSKKKEQSETKQPKKVSSQPSQPKTASKKNGKLVVIDAGHGGKDPGAVANGQEEKKIALQISNRIASELRKRGVNVKMTRTGDTYPTLRDRTTMANNWNADVFISVHLNALPKGRHASGTEIYLMALPTDKDAMELAKFENAEFVEGTSSKKSDSRTELLLSILGDMQQNAKIGESTDLAEELFKAGQSGGLNMRRVAQAPFWVLRGAAMPAVLIETGFITELSDIRQLIKAPFQQKMAEAFADGVVRFLNR